MSKHPRRLNNIRTTKTISKFPIHYIIHLCISYSPSPSTLIPILVPTNSPYISVNVKLPPDLRYPTFIHKLFSVISPDRIPIYSVRGFVKVESDVFLLFDRVVRSTIWNCVSYTIMHIILPCDLSYLSPWLCLWPFPLLTLVLHSQHRMRLKGDWIRSCLEKVEKEAVIYLEEIWLTHISASINLGLVVPCLPIV